MAAFVLMLASAPVTPAPTGIAASGLTVPTDVVNVALYARSSLTSLNAADFKLNMTQEFLDIPNDYIIAGMSIDGGTTWVRVNFNRTLQRLLDRGGTLWITDELGEGRRVNPASAANTVRWRAIQARPRPNPAGAKVTYGVEINPSSTGWVPAWYLSTNFTLSGRVGGYEFTKADGARARTPAADAVWLPYPRVGGGVDSSSNLRFSEHFIQIPNMPSPNTVARDMYFFRVSATANSVGSRPWRVTVSSATRAPRLRINYNTETIRIRAGDIALVMVATWGPWHLEEINYTGEPGDYSISGILTGTNFAGADFGNEIHLVTISTGKRPESATQITTLLPRAEMPPVGDLIIRQGRLDTTQIRDWDFSTNGGRTWGRLPAINRDFTGDQLMARVKPNVRAGAAASRPVNLEITFGRLNANDSHVGITSAKIIHPITPP
jgi:hypothetical protein